MQSDSAPPPPLLVYVLSSTLDVYEGPRFEKRAGFVFDKPSLFCTSEDGSVLFVSSEDDRRVATFNALTGKEICVWKVEQPIVKAYLSPLGSYVLSWHYPPRRRDGEPEPSAESHDNLVVWDSKTGKVVWRTQVKNQPESDVWPSIQWTDDERFAARMTTSTLHVFNGKQLDGKEEFNLVVKNMHQFSIVCGVSKDKSGENVKQYRVATFVPEKNNTMSNVMVWRIFERIGNAPQEMPQKEVTKVFGRGQKVDFLWNSPATAMVIKAFSAVDKSGGSYYGTYDCFYVRVDGSVDVTLRPKREGTIHDVKWDVHGRRFIMVYGAQPASATVYNFKANVVAEFGVGPRNFAAFSPSGQMVTLAGFGSLQGGIEVWDSKLIKKVALAESFAASTYQWAPDSRHFLTAVLQDRMKVDNMVRIFAYDGTVIKEINKGSPTLLKAVSWRPCPRGTYESQPPSPRCFEKAAKAEAAMQANPVRQKYVPPGMRNASPGAVSAASAALSNLRGTDSAAVVGRVQQSNAASSGSSVKTPAAPVAAKPQRQLIVGEVADDEEPAPARDNSKAKAKRDAKKEKQRAEAEAAQKKEESAAKPVYDADAYSTDPIAVEKRIKKLKAKLRQIDQLKGKDRATLAPEQRAKLDEEASVVRLVAELEALRPKH